MDKKGRGREDWEKPNEGRKFYNVNIRKTLDNEDDTGGVLIGAPFEFDLESLQVVKQKYIILMLCV